MKKSLNMEMDGLWIFDELESCTYCQLQMLDDEITVHARMDYLPFSFK